MNTQKKQILLIEDDLALSNGIVMVLQGETNLITQCFNLKTAREALQKENFALVILDINLPDGNGLELLKEIKEKYVVPVILLTANDMEIDVVTGLEMGADDYITKPFMPMEVCARVRSQLRRYMQLGSGVAKEATLVIGGIELNDATKQVSLDGEEVNLTPTEYAILKFFMEHPGRVFSPKEIYEKVWNDLSYGSEGTVAVHIRHLREKIEINPAEPRYLKVVWGQGYKIEKGVRE